MRSTLSLCGIAPVSARCLRGQQRLHVPSPRQQQRHPIAIVTGPSSRVDGPRRRGFRPPDDAPWVVQRAASAPTNADQVALERRSEPARRRSRAAAVGRRGLRLATDVGVSQSGPRHQAGLVDRADHGTGSVEMTLDRQPKREPGSRQPNHNCRHDSIFFPSPAPGLCDARRVLFWPDPARVLWRPVAAGAAAARAAVRPLEIPGHLLSGLANRSNPSSMCRETRRRTHTDVASETRGRRLREKLSHAYGGRSYRNNKRTRC